MAGRRGNEFKESVKRLLAARAGHRCSHPDCEAPTSAAASTPGGVRRVGEASHIAGAAPGSARYDEAMSPAERSAADNGIWLCRNHAKIVDDDEDSFPPELLKAWRTMREVKAQQELGKARTARAEQAVPKWKALAGELSQATQPTWWRRLQKFIAALETDPRVSAALPQQPAQPGDPGFLWSLEDAPLDTSEHGRAAFQAVKFFTRSPLPTRIGDFRPSTHALSQVQERDRFRERVWPTRRSMLVETYIEPLAEWAESLSLTASSPMASPELHLELMELEDRIANEEARRRKVRVTYIRNIWPGHRGTYNMSHPEGGTFSLDVGDSGEIEAEFAANIEADHGDAFSFEGELPPPTPDGARSSRRRFLTQREMGQLRARRRRLRSVLGIPES